MKVRWTSPALRQLRTVEAYLSERNRGAAFRIVGLIDAGANRLASMPLIGRPARERDVRELVIVKARYIIVYHVRVDEILILALFHERQLRPDSIL